MNNWPEGYLNWTHEQRAQWRRENTKPPLLEVPYYERRQRIFMSDGREAVCLIRYIHDATPVFMEDPPGHHEDHKWQYPFLRKVVIDGPHDALELECDMKTCYAQRKNEQSRDQETAAAGTA